MFATECFKPTSKFTISARVYHGCNEIDSHDNKEEAPGIIINGTGIIPNQSFRCS